MKRVTITIAFCLLIVANAAYGRISTVELDATNLEKHGASITFKKQPNGLLSVVLTMKDHPQSSFIANIKFMMKGKTLAYTHCRVERKDDMAKVYFFMAEELVADSVLSVSGAPMGIDHMRTDYTLKLSKVYSPKTISGSGELYNKFRVELHHKFDTKKEKQQFVDNFFKTFGKQEGILLASLAVRYTWNLTDTVVILEDWTGNRNTPSVNLIIIKKEKKTKDSSN